MVGATAVVVLLLPPTEEAGETLPLPPAPATEVRTGDDALGGDPASEAGVVGESLLSPAVTADVRDPSIVATE